MAKTVKFNLILDGFPVRNLEGLREHFSIEDMLEYYNNGLLVKWLDVRGYVDELEKVRGICSLENKESEEARYAIVTALIKIFEIKLDDAQIKEDLAIFSYVDEKKRALDEYKNNAFEADKIIEDYHANYSSLIQHMIDNKDSMALLKADVLEIEKSYMGLFKLDYYNVYFKLLSDAPKAIYALLTRPELRAFYIGETVPSQITKSLNTEIIPLAKICEHIEEDISVVKRDTQGMWDPIERGDVDLMVLYVASSGAFVKNYQGPLDEKLGSADINGKFVILKGIEYQCNNSNNDLVYMEV